MQKDIFWKAAILTATVFLLGLFLGYQLDSMRAEDIQSFYKEIETGWRDIQLQSLYYQINPPSEGFCKVAIEQNLDFDYRTYMTGLEIEKYEQANKLTPTLILEKKNYALLKLQFWFNNLNLKEACDASFINLVYFYSQYPEDMDIEAQQTVLSRLLTELKTTHGDTLMVIPLPIDLDISTIDLIKEQYNITKAPTVLIDETVMLEGVITKEDIEKYL